MAYNGGKIDWKGVCDGTPSARPTSNLRDDAEPARPSGNDWHGQMDGTPPSKPTAPDKA